MRSVLTTARRTVQRRQLHSRLQSEIARLEANDDVSPAQGLAQRLRAVDTPPDEAASAWFARIEAERARLIDSTAPLTRSRGEPLKVGEVTRRASVPPHEGRLLFALAREADRVLELGTSVGISGAYLGAALAGRPAAMLRSIEGHADRAEIARDVWRRLGLHNAEVVVGRFADRLDEALATGPYDLVFVDGHHDGEATRGYVVAIQRASRPGTLIAIDDIDWSDGMRAGWMTLRSTLTDSATADLGRLGLILLGKGDTGV